MASENVYIITGEISCFDKEISASGSFTKGKKTGIWEYYDKNSTLLRRVKYFHPELETLSKNRFLYNDKLLKINSNEEMFFSGSIIKNKKHGIWKYYNGKGELIKEEYYEHGELIEN